MYIRCKDCQSSTWLDRLDVVSAQSTVACQSCGRSYSLAAAGDLGPTQREQYQRALGFAEQHGIDLPSAYSVLLGIMSVDDARRLREKPARATARVASARTDARWVERNSRGERVRQSAQGVQPLPGPSSHRAPAISRRGQSPRSTPGGPGGPAAAVQGFERRNRILLAARLAGKHNLPMKLAHQVVSNQLTLHAALVARDTEKARRAVRKPITTSQRLAVATFVVLVVVGVAAYGLKTWTGFGDEARSVAQLSEVAAQKAAAESSAPSTSTPGAQPARLIEDHEIVRDAKGRLVSVSGPDPRSVLIRYCEEVTDQRVEPVELAPAVPPRPGSRLGVFRSIDRLGANFAIRIRKDRRTGRWVAGNGDSPIASIVAPEQLENATRIPVSRR